MIIETSNRVQRTPPWGDPARPPQAARPLLMLACWGYAAVVLAVWLFMRQAGDRGWFGTLVLMAPRWPLALPLVLLLPSAGLSRRPGPILGAGAATALVVFGLLGFRVSLPAGGPERGDIRLLTCNVHRAQLDPGLLAEFIALVQPDVVALQDWSSVNDGKLFTGDGWHVKREGELLVASRFPIESVTALPLIEPDETPDGERGAAAVYELRTPRGPIRLINVHLASPHTGLQSVFSDSGDKLADNIERRWRQSAMVRDAAEEAQVPVLLAGDFNTTDDSPMFREHWGGFADAFSERGNGFGYTYVIRRTQLRIDHVLAGPSWRFARCWLGPAVGSPHRPLVADINCR